MGFSTQIHHGSWCPLQLSFHFHHSSALRHIKHQKHVVIGQKPRLSGGVFFFIVNLILMIVPVTGVSVVCICKNGTQYR